jgi:hypothetical protein
MTTDEAYWVGLVGFSIAAVCIAALALIAVREKRPTGRWPAWITVSSTGVGWFSFLAFMFLMSHSSVPQPTMRQFPLCVLYPGLDLALLIGSAALAGRAFAYAFRQDWQWRVGLWIAWHLIWPALFVWAIYSDVTSLRGMSWVWIPAALVAIFAAPFCARFAYQELVARGKYPASTSPDGSSRLWRPGRPQ